MILLDTSGALAAFFPDQNRHQDCATALQSASGPFVLSPFVLAELDYLLVKFAGIDAESRFLRDVAAEAYTLAPFGPYDVARAAEVVEQYRDLNVGLADASIVVLSERLEAVDVLTLDERHFRVLRGGNNQPFRILPSDA